MNLFRINKGVEEQIVKKNFKFDLKGNECKEIPFKVYKFFLEQNINLNHFILIDTKVNKSHFNYKMQNIQQFNLFVNERIQDYLDSVPCVNSFSLFFEAYTQEDISEDTFFKIQKETKIEERLSSFYVVIPSDIPLQEISNSFDLLPIGEKKRSVYELSIEYYVNLSFYKIEISMYNLKDNCYVSLLVGEYIQGKNTFEKSSIFNKIINYGLKEISSKKSSM